MRLESIAHPCAPRTVGGGMVPWRLRDARLGVPRAVHAIAGAEELGVESIVFVPGRPEAVLVHTYASRLTFVSDADGRPLPATDERHVYVRDFGTISAVAFSADGARMALGGTDGAVSVWDMRDAARPDFLTVHKGAHVSPVRACVFSPDGEHVYSFEAVGRAVHCWTVAEHAERIGERAETHAFPCPAGTVSGISLGGDLLLMRTSLSRLAAFDVVTHQVVGEWRVGRSVEIDGFTLAAGDVARFATSDATLSEWDVGLASPRRVHAWERSKYGAVTCIRESRNKAVCVCLDTTAGRVTVLRAASWDVWATISYADVLAVAPSALPVASLDEDGQRMLVAKADDWALEVVHVKHPLYDDDALSSSTSLDAKDEP